MDRGSLTFAHLTRLAHDARAAGSRTVQTAAVLIVVACVLLADSVRIAVAEQLLLELLLLLPMAGVLCYALGVMRQPDVRLTASLRELIEKPTFQRTLHLADSRLQRARRHLRALAMHACILLDSYLWSRAAVPTSSSVRIEHLNALFALVETWLHNRSLSGVIDALAAYLLGSIDQLHAALSPRRLRTAYTATLIIPRPLLCAQPAPADAPGANMLC